MNSATATRKPKTTYYYKLFRVKRKDGRVTTVSMDPVLVTRACQAMGNLQHVGKVVREAAAAYDESMYKNCSGYVSEQVKQAMTDALAVRSVAAQTA